MKSRQPFVKSAYLYIQASKLLMSARPLHQKIQALNDELISLDALEDTGAKKTRIHNLNDEIFSYQIEIQALRLKADRLIKQAHHEHYEYAETE